MKGPKDTAHTAITDPARLRKWATAAGPLKTAEEWSLTIHSQECVLLRPAAEQSQGLFKIGHCVLQHASGTQVLAADVHSGMAHE